MAADNEGQSVSLWRALGVGLPALNYEINETDLQGKGSTKFASFSRTPTTVTVWTDFNRFVESASGGVLAGSSAGVKGDIVGTMNTAAEYTIPEVGQEEDVTQATLSLLLAAFRNTTVDIKFQATPKYTLSDPDIIAQQRVNENKFLKIAKNVARKTLYQEERRDAVLFTFETKPQWKFEFLLGPNSENTICQLWQSLDGEDIKYTLATRKKPKKWTIEQEKVFHLIRQVYGQMATSERRFGVIHIYEKWWFCCRTEEGELKVSPEVLRTQTETSVLQCIFALSTSTRFVLKESALHPLSPTRGDREQEEEGKEEEDSKPQALKRPTTQSSRGNAKSAAHGSASGSGCAAHASLASTLSAEDCELLYSTDRAKLAVHRKHPFVLIKIARGKQNVIEELDHEISVYEELMKLPLASKAITTYYGGSKHLGSPLLCLGHEGPTLDEIGVDNASKALRLSALNAVESLSSVGLIHGDLELRNIVQSSTDPTRALIIDFGRAFFTQDQRELDQQIEAAKHLLLLENVTSPPRSSV